MLGVPRGRTVLFCAVDDFSRPLKGGDLVTEAIRALPRPLKSKLFLLLLGRKNDHVRTAVDIPSLPLGYVTGDAVKAIAYSAADILVHPTRAENFPLVLLESMACGTPAVSFRVGGVPETVREGVTGSLAEPDSPLKLRDAIVRLLADRRELAAMRARCRDLVVREYPLSRQADRYVDLYRAVLCAAAAGTPVAAVEPAGGSAPDARAGAEPARFPDEAAARAEVSAVAGAPLS
jgi:glycosyltransferase involved in cell wall biosynthesis